MLGWLIVIIAGLAGLVLLLTQDGETFATLPAGLVAIGVIASLVGLYVSAQRRRGYWEKGKLLAFGALIIAAIGAAAWWYGPQLLGDQKSPSQEERALGNSGAVSVLIRRSESGTFAAQGRINESPADFLIDTGAGAVMLRYSDAEKAGLDVERLSFTTPVKTANGTVYAAPVRLRSVTIGLIRLEDLEALVAKPGRLNENLLGMTFLRRLSSYSLKGDFLTLRQ